MKRIVHYLHEEMADFETVLALYFINYSSYGIVTATVDGKPVKGKSGSVYSPDYCISELVAAEDIAGVIIPGGSKLVEDRNLNQLLLKVHKNNGLIASICAGPTHLAWAGILEDRSFATSIDRPEDETGSPLPWRNYKTDRFVVDRNVITAKGTSFIDFAIEIGDWCGVFADKAEKENDRLIYKGLQDE